MNLFEEKKNGAIIPSNLKFTRNVYLEFFVTKNDYLNYRRPNNRTTYSSGRIWCIVSCGS